MPLDNTNWSYDTDRAWKDHCIGWETKISFWPRRCYYSNKLLWFKFAYKGTAMWTGPGEPVFEHRWIDKNQYLLEKVKGSI